MEFDDEKYFFLDLDKTIWNWDTTIIGAEDLVDTIRETDREAYFHTDNTLLTRKEYAKKLTAMGIPANEEDVFTSGYVAAKELSDQNITKAYVVGESGLFAELEAEGIENSEDAEVAVVGFDRQFNYRKLKRLMDIASEGGDIYVCSNELTFRKSTGDQPHQGPTNRAIESFADVTNLGKPSDAYRRRFKEYFNFFPGRSVFIGDRMADIELGNSLGMTTLAVMTGDITREQLANAEDMQEPDFGLSNLSRLKNRLI